MRDNYYEKYESYEHYPLVKANQDHKQALNKWFQVTTINWTYAEGDQKMVHKNTYRWTLDELIDFIRTTEEVAEDVIDIEPLGRLQTGLHYVP